MLSIPSASDAVRSCLLLIPILVLLGTGSGCEELDPGSILDPNGDGQPGTGMQPAPGSLTATAVSTSEIDLAWVDRSDDELIFEIERAGDAGGAPGRFAVIDSVAAGETVYSDSGLQESTTYHYRVHSSGPRGPSEYSNVASATTLSPPPPPPPSPSDCGCDPLPAPAGEIIEVGNIDELQAAVQTANATGNVTVLVADGTYDLRHQLYITASDVTFRGRSGDRDAVIIRGAGMAGGVPHVFEILGDRFALADMTIGWVRHHGIQIHGEDDADAPWIRNVRFVDTFEQMLKVSFREGDATSSDGGIVECCLFEYSAGSGPQWYIGGVDAHKSHDWIIRDSVFRHITSPESDLAEHAVHFWSDSRNTVVERNVIVDCDRGIGFGLGSRGHAGGIIRNNMIYTTRDVGIGLESSPGTVVAHNTVFIDNYPRAIEYRFAQTVGVSIVNNVTNGAITSRDGGSAALASNVTDAEAAWFVDARAGDLHLAQAVGSVVNQAQNLPGVLVDADCQRRPRGAGSDLGADEVE